MKRSSLDYTGIFLGFLVLALIVFSLIYLLWLRPFYRGESYEGAGVFGPFLTEEKEERISDPISSLTVDNISGNIDITRGSESGVTVHYTKSAPSQDQLDNLTVEITRRGDTLVVKPVYATRLFLQQASVSFDISIPSRVKEISAQSVSGGIFLNGMAPDVEQTLRTVSGSIITDNAADLTARSVSGSIRFIFSGRDLEAHTVSGGIDGTVESLEDGGSIDIGSTSGSVRLAVPASLDAAVNLHSVSGSVSSEIPITVTSSGRNRINGIAGRGTVPVEIGTTSGSIRMVKR
jgi:DUF4097 and DUF4098 domain-containing protein YvlB